MNEESNIKEASKVKKRAHETVSEVLNDLRNRGYTYDFNNKEGFHVTPGKTPFPPDVFQITECYRFEGMSDPSDNTIIYAIRSKKYHLKGVLMNSYGPNSDSFASDLAARLTFADDVISA